MRHQHCIALYLDLLLQLLPGIESLLVFGLLVRHVRVILAHGSLTSLQPQQSDDLDITGGFSLVLLPAAQTNQTAPHA